MKKPIWPKIFSTFLILSMLLAMLPMTSFSTAPKAIGQAELLSPTPDLNMVTEESSSELAEIITFSESPATGFGSNGKFLAHIEPPDLDSTAISTRAELEAIRISATSLGGKYHLVNDIDLRGADWVPIGDNSTASDNSRFTGTFDGQGYVISNLKIIGDTYQYAGLFGYTSTSAIIKNIGLEDTHIDVSYSGNSSAGGICGSSSSTISNCYNTGDISSSSSSSYAGGICGYYFSSNLNISNCYNTGDISSSSISSTSSAGGICGYSSSYNSATCSISYCHNTGNISSSSTSSSSYAGGICGDNYSIRLNTSHCYNTGNISSSSTSSSSCAGGIYGYSYNPDYSPISNCYNIGDISSSSSSSSAGGICGLSYTNNNKSISNCFNTGSVSAFSSSASRSGGICGSCYYIYPSSHFITDCYNIGDVSASAVSYSSATSYAGSGGICGYILGSISTCVILSKRIYAEALNTANAHSYLVGHYSFGIISNNLAIDKIQGNTSVIDDSIARISFEQAKDKATYESLGWDFDDDWIMVPGYDYPQLQELPYFQPKSDPTYTVTFLPGAHGTMNPSPASEDVSYQRTVTSVPSIIPDEGYDFIGWESGIGGIYDAAAIKLYPVNGAMTFTARYVPKASSSDAIAFFDYNGGIAGTDTSSYKSGTPGATYVSPAPTRTGHNLSGWSPAGIGTFGTAGTTIIYTARWTPIEYTATFENDDGSAIDTVTAIAYGTKVEDGAGSIPANPEKSGFSFVGWSDGVSVYSDVSAYIVTGNVKFTARYIPITSSADAIAFFDYNGGVVGTATSSYQNGTPGTQYTPPAPTRMGFSLSGWSPSGSIGTFGAAGSTVIYSAQWIPIKYNVKFEPGDNGAISSGRASESINYGDNVSGVPEISAQKGYVFIGWECSKNKSIYLESGVRIYPVTEDVTFTALYADENDATVIFFYNGGTKGNLVSSYQSGKPGSLYETPEPKREGYFFDRWSPVPGGTFGAAKSITVYTARWTAEIHTVIFQAGGSGEINDKENPAEISLNISHESKVSNVPTVTAAEGYVFVGWECDENGSIYDEKGVKDYSVRANITFTAKYANEAEATVIFFYDKGVADGKISSYVSGIAERKYDPPEPERIGYQLNGWEDEMTGRIFGIFGPPGSVTSYTAQWKAMTFRVNFEKGSNGSIDPDSYSVDISYDSKVTMVPVITPNAGYSTENFWAIKDGGGSLYSRNDIMEMPIRGDITFVAQYSLIATGGSSGGGKAETAVLTVRAIDKATDVPISVQETPVSVGETVKVPAPPVQGYILAEDCEPTKSVTIKAGNNTVDFFYNKKDEPSGQDKRFIVSDKIKEVLETEEHVQYINGYPDGTVRPNSNITRAEVATIFWRLLKAPEKNDVVVNTFSDLKGDESYAQAVKYLAKIGILQGYEDGSFRPSRGITRAEFVAIACRFDDLENSNSNPFTDLAGSHWAYSYIISAYLKGWISGYPDGEFKPQNGVSRAEVVKIVNCMLGRGIKLADLLEDLPSYTDLTSSHWAYCEIIEATVSHEFERQVDGWEIWK